MRAGWLAVVCIGMCGVGASAEDKTTAPPAGPATRPFVISKETTYYTGPVRADGTIDYVEAINDRLAVGATRENNAAIPLLDALTRGRGDQVAHYKKIWDKLGGPPTGPHADDDLGNPPLNDPDGMDFALQNPWTVEKVPAVAKWLEAWNPRLDLVVEASRRSHFYLPLVREHPEDSTVAVLLPQLNYMRQTVNALKARALLRLGNEDMEGFVRDVMAIVRIGRLATHAPTLVERLVAQGCEATALQAVQVAATGGWLSAAQVDQILAELRGLSSSPMYESFEMGERSFMLEFLQTAAVHGVGEASKMLDPAMPANRKNAAQAPLPPVDPAAKDWNAALRKANSWYDRLEDAGKQATFARRQEASEEIMREVQAMRVRQDGWRGLFVPIEDRAIVMVIPSMNRAYLTEARVQTARTLTEVALALSAFRAKTGEYPAALRELVPAYFKAEPIDPLNEKPLAYRPEGAGYVLRSLGQNGQQDDGPKSDDQVLRAER